jgi:hypothetical protein
MQGRNKQRESATTYLKEGRCISDVVTHLPLSSDTDLILANRSLRPGFLYPLVPIHS